jgi:hypothetical protein
VGLRLVGGALALLVLAVPSARADVVVVDRCTGTDHDPEQPIGDAPSTQTIALAVDPAFAGALATIAIDGPSGDQTGSSTVGADGRVEIAVPLREYGTHTVTSASVGDEPLAPDDVVPGGTFDVSDDETPCGAAQLTAAPAAPTTTVTTGAPPRAPTTEPPTTTTQPNRSSDDSKARNVALIVGGAVITIGGIALLWRSRVGALGYARSAGVSTHGDPPLPEDEPSDLGFMPSTPVDPGGRPVTPPAPPDEERSILDDIEGDDTPDRRPPAPPEEDRSILDDIEGDDTPDRPPPPSPATP